MGMAASSLRLTSLTARKNQVEFEGQQINQQRVVLSQESSAVYNQMLEMQVPTAPDPSSYTKIVYKFDNGYGESQIINMAKKASGPYNYNITYKSPATEKVLSKSTYNNVSFTKPTDIQGEEFQYLNTNINGESYQMELVGGENSAKLLLAYKENLNVYEYMKTIEEQIANLSSLNSSEKVGSSKQKNMALVMGINGEDAENSKILDDYIQSLTGVDDQTVAKKNAAQSLYNAGTGQGSIDTNISNEDMINVLKDLLKSYSATNDNSAGYGSSSEYNNAVVVPSYTQYANSAAVTGMTNVDKNQALYQYEDNNGDKAYMYVPLENISDTYQNTYADSVNVYENTISYVENRTEINQQDANIVLSADGQITKITFADGTMVQPSVTNEMDQEAYDFAMVEYEYKKDVYEKNMNDANARIKVIQAQDQKLEVRLKQLDTEQKALSTEIDAVKSVRDKSIEGSFKTFA